MLLFVTWVLTILVAESEVAVAPELTPRQRQEEAIRTYLLAKHSPLAEEVSFLLDQKHWQLLIAISHIESQFCTRKISFNCWGIGGDSAYRHYTSYQEAIKDANDLIEKWQKRGRWLTLEDMNCSYVQPCSPNWLRTTQTTLEEIKKLLESSESTPHNKLGVVFQGVQLAQTLF